MIHSHCKQGGGRGRAFPVCDRAAIRSKPRGRALKFMGTPHA